jgi:pimeloyl-ACP methyl ester carboxylesterase
MRLPAPLALLAAAGLLLAAAPSAGAAIAYAPCPQAPTLQCGSLDVPLDRSGAIPSAAPGAIRLAAVRRLAGAAPSSTAVLGLSGGPGQAAIPFTGDVAQLLAPALTTRDLLVFDQRGTGSSGLLGCSFGSGTLTQGGTTCATQLGARRGLYTTAASVEDIEAVRAASGYAKLVIYGVSYGTKVALDYAARYPSRVEALVLDSVVLPTGVDSLQRSTFAAMKRVLAQLCAGSECSAISSNPARDLANRVRSLARKPLLGPLTSARGVRQRVTIDRDDLFDILFSGDENPTLRAELPGALTSARRGDAAPLIRLAARSRGIISLAGKAGGGARQAAGSDINQAVFAATICEESIFPWDRRVGLAARSQQANAFARALPAGSFSPFDLTTALTTQIIELCVGWPVGSPGYQFAGPLPNVPTLVIDGAADIRTPLEDAAKVKALIPAAQLLAIPFTGHSALASDVTDEHCAARGVGQFFAGQVVTPCAAGDNPFSPTPVAPTRFARLRPTGRSGKLGRTITAAITTARDMRRQAIGDALAAGRLPKRVGGLRGGRAVVSNGRMTLFDAVYVPGVQVSGSLLVNGTGTQSLRVRGSKAAHGVLRVSATSITGVLDHRRISVRARAAATARPADGAGDAALLRRLRLRTGG